jgi:hypothetical protein
MNNKTVKYIVGFILITLVVELLSIAWDLVSFATSPEFSQLLKVL